MPIIRVDFWEGVGEDKVKTMIRGLTKVMVDLGVPAHAVEVIVYEIPKTHWGVGGCLRYSRHSPWRVARRLPALYPGHHEQPLV